jgi:hypothetical protein
MYYYAFGVVKGLGEVGKQLYIAALEYCVS